MEVTTMELRIRERGRKLGASLLPLLTKTLLRRPGYFAAAFGRGEITFLLEGLIVGREGKQGR